MIATLLGTVLPWLVIALGGWLVYQLLRQNGRILLHLQVLEARINQLENIAAPPSAD